jgi:hypothetical protein
MVGEFPELQGLMGGYYARAEGLPDAVADAIRDHYKPVGQGDDVPTAPVSVCVALADKLDTLRSFFAIDEKPTGSKDPFALRRAALGIIRLITENGLRLRWPRAICWPSLPTSRCSSASGRAPRPDRRRLCPGRRERSRAPAGPCRRASGVRRHEDGANLLAGTSARPTSSRRKRLLPANRRWLLLPRSATSLKRPKRR